MLQILADGLVIGSVISLGAIGLSLTLSIVRFSNFSHGELLGWGSYMALSALAVFSATREFLATPLGPFSFWFSFFFRCSNLLLFFYGGVPQYYSQNLQIAIPILPRSVWGGLRVTADQLFVLALTLATVTALHLFLRHSTLGRSMRATAINPSLARVAGIDPERVLRATWIIGGMLAAVAGVFAGITVQLRPTLGVDLLLPLFAAVILGGIGSVWGAVLGGFIVGLAESASVSIVGAEYRAAAAFAVLILILMVRPTGLFPEKH